MHAAEVERVEHCLEDWARLGRRSLTLDDGGADVIGWVESC